MSDLYRFGPFELDARALELRRAGRVVPLQPKMLDLLLILVRSGGEVLEREALQRALWPDVVVTEQSLRQLLYKLRDALGDHAEAIKTLPSRGIRWEPPVTEQREARIPAERDAFVGREAELAQLADALHSSRLVTVMGTGGAGKTRLVLHFCHLQHQDWPGGAWFCDLSEARSAIEVAQVVGEALQLTLVADALSQLGKALRARGRALLVLDNFEQLVPFAEQIVGSWLEAAPALQVLVTSRVVLGVRGEQLLQLPPLAMDDAVALFEQRARAGLREPAPDERALVEQLVRRLDALPLALELAAARARALSLPQLLERLELLSPALREVLDWSWDLLSEDERRALAQLSVFAGGFSVEAVEAVAGFEALLGLLDKSWVHRVGPERFDLLLSLREYATSKLSDPRSVEELHGAWFAKYVSQDALRVLGPELANARLACERALERGDAVVAGQTARVVWKILRRVGPAQLAAELLERALALQPPPLRPEVRLAAAQARAMQGRREEALAALQIALAEARELGDRALCARVLVNTAVALAPEPLLAEVPLMEGLALAREIGFKAMEASAENCRGSQLALRGRAAEGEPHLERALQLFRELGDEASAGKVLGNLANLDQDRGLFSKARERYQAALQVLRGLGEGQVELKVLNNLLALEKRVGTVSAVRHMAEQLLLRHRQAKDRVQEGYTLSHLAELEVAEGHLELASELAHQALLRADEIEDPRLQADVMAVLSALARAQGQDELAHQHAASALSLARELDDPAGMAYGLHLLGQLTGDEALLDEALRLLQPLESPVPRGRVLETLAQLQMQQGRLSEAAATLEAATELLRGCGASRALAEVLCVRAELARLQSDPEASRSTAREAAELAAQVEAGPQSELQRRLSELPQ